MKYTDEFELLSFILEKDELIDDYSFEQFIHESNMDMSIEDPDSVNNEA